MSNNGEKMIDRSIDETELIYNYYDKCFKSVKQQFLFKNSKCHRLMGFKYMVKMIIYVLLFSMDESWTIKLKHRKRCF